MTRRKQLRGKRARERASALIYDTLAQESWSRFLDPFKHAVRCERATALADLARNMKGDKGIRR